MQPEAPAAPLNGRFSGREHFTDMVRGAFEQAAREGWPELLISDASFEDWPLAEAATVESLQQWAKPGRRMVMLAERFDRVQRDQPRFVAWRKANSHLIDCRLCPADAPDGAPSALWSPKWFLQRTDLTACAGVYGVYGVDRRRWMEVREAIESRVRASRPGFPVTTLGL
jgi:hypothetical protein